MPRPAVEDVERYEAAGYPAGLVRVAPPEPGDDVGTFVVFDDGVARFESASGLVSWFTLEAREYDWIC